LADTMIELERRMTCHTIVVFPLSHIYRQLHKIYNKIYKEGITTKSNHNDLSNKEYQALKMAGYN
jgi:hypothetical protein